MQDELKEFCDSILSMSASAISAFGSGLPGMLGKSAAEQGSITPVADTIYELKKRTADFYHAYYQKDKSIINQDAKQIEGLLMNLEMQNVIDREQTDRLINRLHELVANG